jgi:hypothetical protein
MWFFLRQPSSTVHEHNLLRATKPLPHLFAPDPSSAKLLR